MRHPDKQLPKWLSDPLAIDLAQRARPGLSDEIAQLAVRRRGDLLSPDEARVRDILINCGAGPLLICQARTYVVGMDAWKRSATWLPRRHLSAWRDYFIAISARVVRSAIVDFGQHSFKEIYAWSGTPACRGLSVEFAECKAVCLGYTVDGGVPPPPGLGTRGHRQRPAVDDLSPGVLAVAYAHFNEVDKKLAWAFPNDEPARNYAWERMLQRATLSERSDAIHFVGPGLLFLSLQRGIADARDRSARARQAGSPGAGTPAVQPSRLIRQLDAARGHLVKQSQDLLVEVGSGTPVAADPLRPINDALRTCEAVIAHLERGGSEWDGMVEDFAVLVVDPNAATGGDPRGSADACDPAVRRRVTVAVRTLAIAIDATKESRSVAT